MADLQSLRSGNTTSCGCRKSEINSAKQRTHGRTGSRVYRIWANMLSRCGNPNSGKFEFYGGRGIKVCERWKVFANFLADMGEAAETQSLERKDVNGNYEPENCCWIEQRLQARNRRNNRVLTLNGKSQPVSAWAEELQIPRNTIMGRLRIGWSEEKALTEPVDKSLGQYDWSQLPRKKIPYSERLAAVLLLMKRPNGEPLIPPDVAAKGTKSILAHVQWDHIQPVALDGSNEAHNLQPLTRDDHLQKTKSDIRIIAKAKRIAKAQDFHRRVMASKFTDEQREPRQSRFPKGRKLQSRNTFKDRRERA